MLLNAFLKIAGWLCAIAIVVLSLLPQKPQLSVENGQLEHVIAYLGTAALLGACYRTPANRRALLLILLAAPVVLETAQLLFPGRHAQLIDVAAGIAGTGIGLIVAAVVDRMRGIGRPEPA
jgi:VanZ family protein